MPRRRFEWKLRTRSLTLGDRTLVMGVLNITPDSFSDGGQYDDPDRAYLRALQLEDEGADIIDIGAESTKPGSERISEGEELRRLVPVLKRLRGALRVPISVDTYKAAVAEKALEYDAEIINDPSGLTFDTDLAKVAANANAGLIINHMRGTPETWAKLPPLKDVMGSIGKELDAAVNRARRAGIEMERIVVDPGIGFGKRREQNSEILARLAGLNLLNRPILIGPSRKHFLAQPDAELTEFATAAAATVAALNGAHIVRVHEVKAIASALQVVDAVIAAQPEPEAEKENRKRPAVRPAARDQPARTPRIEPPAGKRDEYRAGQSERTPPRSPFERGDARPDRGDRPKGPLVPPRREAPDAGREDRPRASFGESRPDSGEREERPRKAYGPPRESGSREEGPRKSYGPPRESGGREEGPRKSYGPPRGGQDDQSRGERPRAPYGAGRRDSGEREGRPRGPFGPRPGGFGGGSDRGRDDRPPRTFDRPRGGGPPRGDRDDRPPRTFDRPRGERPAGGDREGRPGPGGGKRFGGPKSAGGPPRGGKRFSGGSGRPPARGGPPKRGGGGPKRGGRS